LIVGAAQIEVSIGKKHINLDKCREWLEKASSQGIEILVFPECSLTGYGFNSFEEAFEMSETIPGKSTEMLKTFCYDYKISVVFGLLEKDKGELYNTAVLVSPEGLIGKYRKTHTLCLGVDRYISRGNSLPVFSHPHCKVGILICYDQRFPEPSRIMALKGVQIILNPASLPKGAEAYAKFLNKSRACENRLFIVNANRVGEERGTKYIGRSQIIGPAGQVLAEGSQDKEELVKAEIDVEQANEKHVVISSGEYEYDILKDRRPDLYRKITCF